MKRSWTEARSHRPRSEECVLYEHYSEQHRGAGKLMMAARHRQRDTVMHANVNISTPLKSIQMCLFRWKINKAVREKHSVLQNPADNVISPSSLHTLREVFSSLKLSLFTQLCFTHVTMTFNNKSGKLHLRRSLQSRILHQLCAVYTSYSHLQTNAFWKLH